LTIVIVSSSALLVILTSAVAVVGSAPSVAATAGVVFNQNLGQPITSFDEAITAPTAASE
ncbi:MAG: hypothetical protein II411_04125, partial [Lachnospiraceae bacterium]|nr:hypothetical protein [Lachnospiraceae bacterium]